MRGNVGRNRGRDRDRSHRWGEVGGTHSSTHSTAVEPLAPYFDHLIHGPTSLECLQKLCLSTGVYRLSTPAQVRLSNLAMGVEARIFGERLWLLREDKVHAWRSSLKPRSHHQLCEHSRTRRKDSQPHHSAQDRSLSTLSPFSSPRRHKRGRFNSRGQRMRPRRTQRQPHLPRRCAPPSAIPYI